MWKDFYVYFGRIFILFFKFLFYDERLLLQFPTIKIELFYFKGKFEWLMNILEKLNTEFLLS